MANDPDELPDLPPSAEAERLQAEMDQALAALGDFATTLFRLFGEFVEAGFTEAQALKLVSAWMIQMMTSGGDAE